MQEILTFSSLATLRLCSKQLYDDSSLSKLLNVKKSNVFIPMSTQVFHEDRPKFEAQASVNSLLCMLHKTCEVCGCKTRKRHFNAFANMYGHDACVVQAVVHRYFSPETIEAATMMKNLHANYKLKPYYMERQQKHFKRLRKWLSLPRNSKLRSRYEGKIYEMSYRGAQFLERTVKRNLVIQETCIQWCNYESLDAKAVQHDTVQYIDKILSKRRAMQMELDLLEVPPSARFGQSGLNSFVLDRELSPRDGAIMLAARHASLTYIPQLWLEYPRRLRWEWIDHKRRHMRLWRGIARFAARMARATHRPQEPASKRRRVE